MAKHRLVSLIIILLTGSLAGGVLPGEESDGEFYFRRGWDYYHGRDYIRAEADMTNCIRLQPNRAQAYLVRGACYIERDMPDEALVDFLKTIEINPDYNLAYYNISGIYRWYKKDWDKTIEYATLAIEKDAKAKVDFIAVDAYENRAAAWEQKGRYDKAIADYTSALALEPKNAKLYSLQARANLKRGNYVEALTDSDMALLMEPENPAWYDVRGDVHFALKNIAKAVADYDKCFDLMDEEWFWGNPSIYHGRDYVNLGWKYALQYYQSNKSMTASDQKTMGTLCLDKIGEAVKIIESARLYSGSSSYQFMTGHLDIYFAGIDLASRMDKPEEAFKYSESVRSRAFLDQLGTEAAIQLPEITSSEWNTVRRATRQILELQDQLQTLRSRGDRAGAAIDEAEKKITELQKRLEPLDTVLSRRVPKYRELRYPKAVDVKKAMQWCGNDRVVLEYVLWEDTIPYIAPEGGESLPRPPLSSWCLILSKDGVVPLQLDTNYDYTKAVNTLRDQIIHEGRTRSITVENSGGDMKGIDEENLNALYEKLVLPVLSHIPANIKNVVIVPDGALAFLPFDVLRKEKNSPQFGEQFTLSLSPSVSVSMLTGDDGGRHEPLLAFGGAWYDKNRKAADRGSRDVLFMDTKAQTDTDTEEVVFNGGAGKYFAEKHFRLVDIPGTETEVRSLLALRYSAVKPTAFFGKDVSEAKVKELSNAGKLKTFPLIHFACHGYMDNDNPAMSSIIFSEVSGLVKGSGEDGFLTVPETALLDLEARMVILSACETGLGQVRRGDGMIGLNRSFFIAGAEKVGVSLWSISDAATVRFMTALYKKVIEDGMDFREAYYGVKNEFRRDSTLSHPFFWAAFTYYE